MILWPAIGAILFVLVALACRPIVARIRAQREHKKALSYLRKSEDGEVYIVDPQTQALHKLTDLIEKRIVPGGDHRSPRQRKKAQRRVKAALRA